MVLSGEINAKKVKKKADDLKQYMDKPFKNHGLN